MSLCINPNCEQPDHAGNDGSRFCQSCGSDLVLQDRYRVMRLLNNKSGFGQVYEAYERSSPKVLKVLKEAHNQNPKAIQLFEQEAWVLSHLHTSGVPYVEADGYFKVYPRNAAEPLHCLVMEKIDGPNLKEWMRQQGNHPISEKQALKWLEQIANVLHLVHQQNYFHRDIKPENIMLRSNGQLVLVDFGAVREMTYTYLAHLGGSAGVTRISSAGYTPPEQEKGQAVPQSDFYALGWTFIFLLTGRQPTDPEVYDSLNDEFHWRQLAPHVSPELSDFIDRLIAPKASQRPKNTQEILNTLEQIKQSIYPIPSTVPGVSPATTEEMSVPSHRSQPGQTNRQVSNAQASGGVQTIQQLLTYPEPQYTVQQGNRRWGDRRLWAGLAAGFVALAGWGGWQLYARQAPEVVAPQPVKEEPLTLVAELKGHTGFVNHIIFTPDGQTVISAGADNTILVWNRQTGEALRILKGHTSYVNALVLNGNGQLLASAGADNRILVWDMATGRLLHTLVGHTSPVNAVAISPNGLMVSGSADSTVRVWNLTTGEAVRTLTGYNGFINAIALNPVSRTVAAAGTAEDIMVWNYDTGELVRTYTGHTGPLNAVIYSPDGAGLIAAGTDKLIRIWNVADGAIQQTLSGHKGFINGLAVRGDGQLLLSSDSHGRLIQWDLNQGEAIKIFTGQGAPLDHFTVRSDWRMVATGRGFNDVRLWDLPQP